MNNVSSRLLGNQFVQLLFLAIAVALAVCAWIAVDELRSSQADLRRLETPLEVALPVDTTTPEVAAASGIERRSLKGGLGGSWPLPSSSKSIRPLKPMDMSAFSVLVPSIPPWGPKATLIEIRDSFDRLGYRAIADLDRQLDSLKTLQGAAGADEAELTARLTKAVCLMYEGQAKEAYEVLRQVRQKLDGRPDLAEAWLANVIYFQAVASLRRGEDDNCIMCRGESSCILPIAASALHANEEGSRQAIAHFTEYLQFFPDDLEAKWLLNLAHMTLGEYPAGVESRFRIDLQRFLNPEFDIGRFRDVGHVVGVNRFNQAGGAIMDDFDNDGLFDLAVPSFDPAQVMGLYRNRRDGQFAECAESSGLSDQLGGMTCVQTDYNNDGLIDIFITRGAWLAYPIRPSLLRNDGNWKFTDVTTEAGLDEPFNSNAALWADYDNDGLLDLFVCCETQNHRLYRNLGNGKFEDVAQEAGVADCGQRMGKGFTWIDYDNDDYPDLFISFYRGTAQLYRNNRDGRFSNVTEAMGIDGPETGFTCWAWDYDNDGWTDIFANCYDRTLADVVKGLTGEPHGCRSNKLYRNVNGKRFQDVTAEAGLDVVLAAMACNFSDFDNDGFLDMYLGTGEPNLSTLIPNRMFKNVGGKRFADVTATAGVGHLQKGHGVACGDWDRDGNIDLFVELGGVIPGDKFHNVLFQNPGHDAAWLSVKLIGQKTNRAAIGARIKIVTAGDHPQTIQRHISPGGSFGASPLEQTIGLGGADRIDVLEVHWPTSGTTQVFRDVAVNRCIEIVEFSETLNERAIERVVFKE